MAWIELHQSVITHRKTMAVADQLEITLPQAVGYLATLWLWAVDNAAEDGTLRGISERMIARAAMWEGDPLAFVQALVRAGYLDRIETGDLRLHDWDKYAGRLIQSRKAVSEGGARGNHERWHVQKGAFDPDCPYCVEGSSHDRRATKPVVAWRSGGDRGAISGVDRVPIGGANRTLPNHTVPEKISSSLRSEDSAAASAGAPVGALDGNNSSHPSLTAERVAELWNDVCGGVLPRVDKLTPKRRQHVRARLAADRSRDEAWWRSYFARIRASPFLRGENKSGWRASFDFAIRSEDVVARVLEGQYGAPGAGSEVADFSHLADGEVRRVDLRALLDRMHGRAPP